LFLGNSRLLIRLNKKKPGQKNGVFAVGRKKPGFCCEYQELSVKCEKETRFLLLGQRNRVSAVGIRSYLWDAKKKPGF